MDKNNIQLFFKIGFFILAVFLIFKFGIPAFNKIDDLFTAKVRSFFSMFCKGAVYVKKETQGKQNRYMQTDYEIDLSNFRRLFLLGITDDELEKTIVAGKFLVAKNPSNLRLRRKLAFLYFLDKDYQKAKEEYFSVLKKISGRKLKFENIRSHEYVFSIKRCLLEMAALSYEQNKAEDAFSYYWQFQRANYDADTFKELRNQNFSSNDILYEIYVKISQDGGFALKKSIQGLELLHAKYPMDGVIIRMLFVKYIEIIEFIGKDRIALAGDYITNLENLVKQAADLQDEKIRNELKKTQEKLVNFQAEYKKAITLK